MLMKPEDVALNVIDSAKIFHFGSITLISEPSRSATIKAAEYANEKGLIVSYDPNLRLALWENAEAARAGMISGLDYATIVKVSDEEVEFMTGGDDVTPLWRDNIQLIVVTQGAEGSTAYTRDAKIHAPSFAVNSVDTTGAGDGFVAGLLTSVLKNPNDYADKLGDILRFANGVGALTTTQRGAIPALPTRDQVTRFLAAR
jgi:fructokinase